MATALLTRHWHTKAMVAVFEWESAAALKAGVTLSLLRFALAFFASVLVGAVYRLVPTVKGERRSCRCKVGRKVALLIIRPKLYLGKAQTGLQQVVRLPTCADAITTCWLCISTTLLHWPLS